MNRWIKAIGNFTFLYNVNFTFKYTEMILGDDDYE